MAEKNLALNFTILIISILLFLSCFLPIIGPLTVSWALGFNKKRHELYGMLKKHSLMAITIGELMFFTSLSWILASGVEFYNPVLFWYIVVGAFVLTYALSIIFYFIGVYQYKKR